MGKRENAGYIPAYSPFPTMFSEAFFPRLLLYGKELIKCTTLQAKQICQ